VLNIFYILIAVLAGGGVFSQALWASDLRYAWIAEPNVLYYRGTYRIDSRTTKFISLSNWITLEQPGLVQVQAITTLGLVHGSLAMKFPTEIAPEPPQHRREVLPETKPQINGQPPPELGRQPLPASKQNQSEKAPPELTDDEVISDVLEHSNASPQNVAGKKRVTRAQLAVSAALGHEGLRAAGGITDYSASALVAGALISATWGNRRDFWYVIVSAEMHRLNVMEQIVTPTGIGNGQSSSHFFRTFATAGVYYDLLNSTSASAKRLGFGLGLAHLRLPMLKALAGGSEAQPNQQNAFGPYVGMDFGWDVSNTTRFAVVAELMPLAFTRSIGAFAVHAQGSASRFLAKKWSGLATLDLARQSLNSKGDCPAVANCADQMSAYSTVVLTSVGVAYHL